MKLLVLLLTLKLYFRINMLKVKFGRVYKFICAYEYKKNDKMILKYFEQSLYKLECIVMFAINTGN